MGGMLDFSARRHTFILSGSGSSNTGGVPGRLGIVLRNVELPDHSASESGMRCIGHDRRGTNAPTMQELDLIMTPWPMILPRFYTLSIFDARRSSAIPWR